MRILCVLIFFLCIRAQAELFHSDAYRCEIELPSSSTWLRGAPQRLPVGDMVFVISAVETKQNVVVICVENFLVPNLESPAAASRILELIRALGFTSQAPEMVKWLDQPAVQFRTARSEGEGEKLFGLARATMRERALYLVFTAQAGEEGLMQNERFMSPFTGFHFVTDPPPLPPEANPLFPAYVRAYKAAAALLAALALGGITVFFTTLRRH